MKVSITISHCLVNFTLQTFAVSLSAFKRGAGSRFTHFLSSPSIPPFLKHLRLVNSRDRHLLFTSVAPGLSSGNFCIARGVGWISIQQSSFFAPSGKCRNGWKLFNEYYKPGVVMDSFKDRNAHMRHLEQNVRRSLIWMPFKSHVHEIFFYFNGKLLMASWTRQHFHTKCVALLTHSQSLFLNKSFQNCQFV